MLPRSIGFALSLASVLDGASELMRSGYGRPRRITVLPPVPKVLRVLGAHESTAAAVLTVSNFPNTELTILNFG